MKLFLPDDLSYKREQVIGTGFFQPNDGNNIIDLNGIDVERDPATGYRSLVIPACMLKDFVGYSPTGGLEVSTISTPVAIKDSKKFKVEIYKDSALEYMIAKIETGQYISFNDLKPGKVTIQSFVPRDTKVQAETTVDIVIVAEHQLTEKGSIIIQFPEDMILPAPGTKVTVTPGFGE